MLADLQGHRDMDGARYLENGRLTIFKRSGVYYARLVARGMRKRGALMAVMRKMLIVAVHLLKTGEMYDPSKVSVAAAS